MPTAVFFGSEHPNPVAYGRAAVAEYLDGTPGRLMRSLKSLLGSALIEEATAVGDRNIRFTDIVMLYLRMLRERASQVSGSALDRVVLGRPVRFVDDDPVADRRAEATLGDCARRAGFSTVEFQFEPIAAAFDYEQTLAREERVLVVDVGGGTADFTVIRLSPDRRGRAERNDDVLANDGVHVAGTDFDSRLHMAWVMPVLGLGARGTRGREIPSPVYFDLSTWHRINFLYSPRFSGTLRDLRPFYEDPALHDRLARVIDQRAGHLLLGRTEAAKIALSAATEATIDLASVEPDLVVQVGRPDLLGRLADLLGRLVSLGRSTVTAAGVRPQDIDTLYFTGGSSGMSALREAFVPAFPGARVVVGDLFGSVATGLGLEAARRFG